MKPWACHKASPMFRAQGFMCSHRAVPARSKHSWNFTSKKCIFTMELLLQFMQGKLEIHLQKPKEQCSARGTQQGCCYSCHRSQTSLSFGPHPSPDLKRSHTTPQSCFTSMWPLLKCSAVLREARCQGEKPITSTIGLGYCCHSLKP